ncbi:MAG: bifunctional alpha/beta hydrolase/OsmC family protein [Bacteroidia bacterium]|nr:bifunctional alpha/beta hydrolase/OsmC family protein [Bacteroidia bacterium]
MKSIAIKINNNKGESLSARLELPPDRHPHNYAIFAHCFTCSKNLSAVVNISRTLTLSGFAVLRFDFTGLGESEGEFSSSGFSSNVNDLICAAEYLSENHMAPSLLIGHSLGGAAVLVASEQIESIKAVATIGAPSHIDHVKHLFSNSIDEIKTKGIADVSIGGRPFKIGSDFIEDLEQLGSKTIANSQQKALLIMHSPQDTVVSIEHATKLYKNAQHPKSFISLDGADHLLSKKSDSIHTGEMIASWAKRYIQIKQENVPVTKMQVVARTASSSFTTDIVAGKHTLTADEPESVGGNNFGPSPYDYLSAALAACTSMTILMYVKHKKWQLDEVSVHVQHGKDYHSDADNPEETNKKIDHFVRSIELEGDLDKDQISRILKIADKCPVHKTLHSEIKISTRLAGNEVLLKKH